MAAPFILRLPGTVVNVVNSYAATSLSVPLYHIHKRKRFVSSESYGDMARE